MKLHKALAGMDRLRFNTIRRDSWPVGENMIIDSRLLQYQRNIGGGPYTLYRLNQDDYFATDWRGDPVNPTPNLGTMTLQQLLMETNDRSVLVHPSGDNKDSLVFALKIRGSRRNFGFTLSGNNLTRI